MDLVLGKDYDIERAFREIENELIASMIRNMKRHRLEEIKEKRQWSMWQAEQLKALEKYKKQNREKFKSQFSNINKSVREVIYAARQQGGLSQEIKILHKIQRGYRPSVIPHRVKEILREFDGMSLKEAAGFLLRNDNTISGEFFRLNTRKLEALIKATQADFEKAEIAILRRSEDQYRKIIFNAQVYGNTGAGTYEQAVDMATKDFLSKGIDCIEYANGARHTVANYAAMAIQTASKRAYLAGEGEIRQEWGISTVIMNKRGNPCPKCLPFVGKVLIDDVWSGGNQSDGKYMLMSNAIAAGLYHPYCRDSHTTYFAGITSPGAEYSKKELMQIESSYKQEQQRRYAVRQVGKFRRLSENSLDEKNKIQYDNKMRQWKSIDENMKSDILKEKITEEDTPVHLVGKLDKDIYKCVTNDIVADEVIITDKQIQHIKDRHPNDFERYQRYFKDIVERPDYIIEASRPNTALVLKEIEFGGEVFKTVVRLVTSGDDASYKNSIITFMKINEKEWNRLLRNKKVLYKAE